MMCVTSFLLVVLIILPQPGKSIAWGKLHTLFTDWSKTDDFIHKMFKIRKQFARRSSAVLPVGGIGICLTAVWPSQRISALIENVGTSWETVTRP